MLTRGTAPEVVSRDQNGRTGPVRSVQGKVRTQRAIRGAAEILKDMFAEPGFVRDLEESGRNDLVRIDVVHRK